MEVRIENRYRYFCELRGSPNLASAPLASEDATLSLGELIDETYHRGVLAERFPAEPEAVHAAIRPIWSQEPLVGRVQVELTAVNGEAARYSQEFDSGPWVRRAQLKALVLKEEGSLGPRQKAYRALMAVRTDTDWRVAVPPLLAPEIVEGRLEDVGVRGLGAGELVPDRPVLVNARLAADAIRRCEEAGTRETGGAVLGKILRLPRPLTGAATRVVTVLSSAVDDPRHVGGGSLFTFSPEALADAAEIGRLRGLGELVLTVFHTHGWSPDCRNCNKNTECPLPECSPSLQDYQLAATLFPGKATLMPIVGRKLGEQDDHPVFRVHAWRGGEMRAIRWQAYQD